MRCRSCMFYVPKEGPEGAKLKLGRCRRHSPTMSGFPAVFPADWCGDHKLDETIRAMREYRKKHPKG